MAATRSPLPPRPTSGGRSWYFFLMAFMADGNLGSAPPGSADAIDHDRARGLCDGDAGGQRDQPSGFRVLLTCRPLLIFAACAVMFHFANAAMLPLVGQKLALQDKNFGTTLMSACIVAAQIVMAPVAMLVGRKANVWGRKPLSSPASSSCRSGACSTRSPTTRIDSSACNCSTASGRGSTARCFR